MEDVTKIQIDNAINIYHLVADSYIESISNLTINGHSLSRANFSAIYETIKSGKETESRGLVENIDDEGLSSQMLGLSRVYEKFQSAIEIRSRVSELYKLAVTGRDS